jgi:putative transposase
MPQDKQDLATRPGRYHRGHLPHYDADNITQFITFRLADSLPLAILRGIEYRRAIGAISEADYYQEIDDYLDVGEGPTYLRHPKIADAVAETLVKFDVIKYELFDWVVMPNHAHVLLTPDPKYLLADIMHSIKSYTANIANKLLGREGRFWSPEYFDRFIRDRGHFAAVRKYIVNNPVKAGLSRSAGEWRWSSAYRP